MRNRKSSWIHVPSLCVELCEISMRPPSAILYITDASLSKPLVKWQVVTEHRKFQEISGALYFSLVSTRGIVLLLCIYLDHGAKVLESLKTPSTRRGLRCDTPFALCLAPFGQHRDSFLCLVCAPGLSALLAQKKWNVTTIPSCDWLVRYGRYMCAFLIERSRQPAREEKTA